MANCIIGSMSLAAILLLSGCEQTPSNAVAEMGSEEGIDENYEREPAPQRSRSYRAELRCTLNGSPVVIGMCLSSPDQESLPGDLKIRSGNSVRQYTSNELLLPPFFGHLTKFDLEVPFEIRVRTNGDHNIVLRVEIKNGTKTVFQDELSSLSGLIITEDMMADADNDFSSREASNEPPASAVSEEMKQVLEEAQRDTSDAIAKAERAMEEAN